MPDTDSSGSDQNTGVSDKKMTTVDRPVIIVTTSGDYAGTINLNLSSVQINRISDLFVKSDIDFISMVED